MKKATIKNRVIWAAGTTTALCVCFLLCRFAFFELHGMKQWPFALFILGLIVMAVAAFFNKRKVMACTVAGYISGFVSGMLFNTDGVDQGGGGTNNAWKIWTISFIIIIFAGVVWELISKFLKKKRR